MLQRSPIALLALLLAGCAHGHVYGDAPVAAATSYDETGTASWYGEEFAGRPTAAGVPFDPDAITIAHRTLPLGSYVAVTALDTGRTIVATVADRGPFHGERLADLSRGAAHQLGTDLRPVSRVRIRAITPTRDEADALGAGRAARPRAEGTAVASAPALIPPSPTGRYIVRVATFSSEPRATALADALAATLVPVGDLYRVVLGPYDDAAGAQRARDAAAARGYGDAVILPSPDVKDGPRTP